MTTTLFTDHVPSGVHAGRPAASAVPTGTLYACDDHNLVYQSDGTAWSTWYDPGAAAGTLVKDRRWTPGAGETPIDEFNDGTLDPAWVRVDSTGAPAANVTWTEDADSLSAYNAGGDASAAIHGLMRPIGDAPVIGDGFVSHITLLGPNATFTIGGLVVSDGVTANAGTQVGLMTFLNTSTRDMNTNKWTGWTNNTGNQVGTFSTHPHPSYYVRLALVAASTWRADLSPDGITWLKSSATINWAGTPTHVGLLSSSYGTTTKSVVAYEFLRRVSGVS